MNVGEIAQRVGGEVAGDPQLQITGVAGLEFAGPNDLTFADSARAVGRIAASRSAIVWPASNGSSSIPRVRARCDCAWRCR